jgi:hydroxymethylpyrimidine pyrophosphatase-like HAD family hydrolase
MKHQPGALLIDLDGTVLPEGDRPTPAVIEAVQAASQKIPVAIASGRVQDDVCHYARLFGLATPQIADNGATLIDPLTGRAAIRRTFSKADAMHTVSLLEAGASRVLVSDAGRFVPIPEDIAHWDITVIMGEFATEADAVDWANRLESTTVTASVSIDNVNKWYIDCTSAGVDKGFGARSFAEKVGIDLADLVVIGDGFNDIPMFKVAGTSIAMDGAPAELLELANAVAPSIDHDGAARAIENYVLNRL